MGSNVSAFENANSTSQLKAAVDALPRKKKCYSKQMRDILLQQQKLISDSPTADSVAAFLNAFALREDKRPLLRTHEMHDLIINILAPKISDGEPVDNLGGTICSIVQDKSSAELYSTPESLNAVLSCFHRATTAEAARWIASSINNIVWYNPSANKLLNGLPVVEAFSALLPQATSDEAVEWVSRTLQKILHENAEAVKMFGTPTFFDQFKTLEKHATSSAAKDSFKSAFIDAIFAWEQKYYTAQTRDLLLQQQQFIEDAPTADSVASFLRSFSVLEQALLRTREIRDLIVNVLAPKVSRGDPVDHLGRAICDIVQDKSSAELYSTPESLKAILSCFHRTTTAESARWIAGSINNILISNPTSRKLLSGLPVVEAFSALLPHATSDDAVEWVSNSLKAILDGNDEAVKMFRTPAFFEQFKTLENYATSDAAKASFMSVVYQLQSIVDRRAAIEKSLRDAKNSQELTSAVDSITKQSDFWPSLVDALLSKQHLVVDSPTADAVASLLHSFSRPDDKSPLLRTPEIRDLINVLAPKISGGDPVYYLGFAVCGIVRDKSSAELYSNPESLKAILSCFHRVTSAGSAEWAAGSINNILFHNPSANKLLNGLPVVEAFSALLPHATSDEAVEWVSNSLKAILRDNDEALKMFATPTFFELFMAMEKCATSKAAKDAFKWVVGKLQSIVDRRTPIEKPLRDAKTSQEFTAALDFIVKLSDFWSTLVDLVVSKQHLIQNKESTTSTAKFIKWCCEKNEKLIQRQEIYDLFENVILPNSLKFIESVPHVHEALSLVVKNNKEAQEFFSTHSFKEHVSASLPHADESLLKILNALLIGNNGAREIFGTPDFKKKIESKFVSSVPPEFKSVITILTLHIIQVRFNLLKKLAADHNEEIDEECLKKLAENETDVADLLFVDVSSLVMTQLQCSFKQVVALTRLIQKIKNKSNGVSVHQDPFKRQHLEQIRQEHNDLRKLHQDHVTSSSKLIDDLKNQLQNEKTKHATTAADRDGKQLLISSLDQNLADEKKTSRDFADSSKKLNQDLDDLRKLHQVHVTSSSKAIADLEKLHQNLAREFDAEKKNHLSTTTERDAKILQLVDLNKSLDDAKKQLQSSQQDAANLQSQLDSISPFVKDKLYQIDSNVNNLPPPTQAGVVERHPVVKTTRIFAEAQKLMTKGGALIYDATSPNEFKFSPVQGFTLQSVDVILRSTSGFEDRLKKLQGLRSNVKEQFNPSFPALLPEKQKVLKILFAHFLPRPPTVNAKFPNLVNVFHGTRIDRLDAAMDGLRAMRETDNGFFGVGCYTTTSIEYAAQYARGDLAPLGAPAPTQRDGCYPVLWCVAAIGVCYPVSRADYSPTRTHPTFGQISKFFGAPLNNNCDCHCAVVGSGHSYQAVSPTDMNYMEIVVDQEIQVIPIAVLWVK